MFLKTAFLTFPVLVALQQDINIENTIPPPLKIGTITSEFGDRIHPILNISKPHFGIDISAEENSKALAIGAGIVIFAGEYAGYGNLVTVKHSNGISTHYAHLDNISLSVGRIIEEGEEIGTIGRTGNTTGLHLHFEVRKDGTPIDPVSAVPSLNALRGGSV